MSAQSPVRVLLIDDEHEFRAATRAPLERRGFSVSEAPDGLTGLALVIEEQPDVVLLDLRMPRLSGLETLSRIREVAPHLPVIVLTGHGRFDDALAGIRLEIVDFLQKPVHIDELAARIRALLERPGPPEPLRERTIRELMVPRAVPAARARPVARLGARDALHGVVRAGRDHRGGQWPPLGAGV